MPIRSSTAAARAFVGPPAPKTDPVFQAAIDKFSARLDDVLFDGRDLDKAVRELLAVMPVSAVSEGLGDRIRQAMKDPAGPARLKDLLQNLGALGTPGAAALGATGWIKGSSTLRKLHVAPEVKSPLIGKHVRATAGLDFGPKLADPTLQLGAELAVPNFSLGAAANLDAHGRPRSLTFSSELSTDHLYAWGQATVDRQGLSYGYLGFNGSALDRLYVSGSAEVDREGLSNAQLDAYYLATPKLSLSAEVMHGRYWRSATVGASYAPTDRLRLDGTLGKAGEHPTAEAQVRLKLGEHADAGAGVKREGGHTTAAARLRVRW